MSDLLKAVEEAAYRLARAQAARDVIQRSLDGIIAEQERRAEAKAAAMNPDKNLKIAPAPMINSDMGEDPVDELIDDDDNYAAHLGNAILAIINDARLSRDEKRQKVLGALKLLDEDDEEEDEMPEMAPPPMINTEMAETPKEPFDQAFFDRLPPSDRPFKKLSAEETKLICEQVVRFQKVMKEQLERDKKTYREMYGEEMPEL